MPDYLPKQRIITSKVYCVCAIGLSSLAIHMSKMFNRKGSLQVFKNSVIPSSCLKWMYLVLCNVLPLLLRELLFMHKN